MPVSLSTNPTWADLSVNPGLQSEKLATNHLSYGPSFIVHFVRDMLTTVSNFTPVGRKSLLCIICEQTTILNTLDYPGYEGEKTYNLKPFVLVHSQNFTNLFAVLFILTLTLRNSL